MTRVSVKPEMLHWACERAGLDPAELAHRLPDFPTWESGEKQPTLKQLEGFARLTHTPIGFFFLPSPPVERVPIPDLRTVADIPVGRPSPDLLDALYLCQQRQDWFRDFARLMHEARPAFVGSARVGDSVVEAAARMRQALGFDLDERRSLPTWMEALRLFIEQAEDAGILVMVSGVVGSNNRRRLDPEEFRGFALADDVAPLVFVNGADTKAAQMFTLAHELAHIWLGESALTNARLYAPPRQHVERWCNQVAAELLVPISALRDEHKRDAEPKGEATRLARRFKVSTLVILRRLHDAGRLNSDEYWDLFEAERARLLARPKGSGGDFYLTLGARVGKRFARALVTSTLEGRASFTEAFRLLGMKKMATFRELGHSLGVVF